MSYSNGDGFCLAVPVAITRRLWLTAESACRMSLTQLKKKVEKLEVALLQRDAENAALSQEIFYFGRDRH
jgi:hypothetical protein